MSLIDELLALDSKEITEKDTATVEIKKLSKKLGKPFLVTVQAIDPELYMELSTDMLDKKGNVDYSKAFKQNTLIVLEGVIEPNLKDEKLLKHFGAATPKELAEKLFEGAIPIIAAKVGEISGFDNEVEEEIKN